MITGFAALLRLTINARFGFTPCKICLDGSINAGPPETITSAIHIFIPIINAIFIIFYS